MLSPHFETFGIYGQHFSLVLYIILFKDFMAFLWHVVSRDKYKCSLFDYFISLLIIVTSYGEMRYKEHTMAYFGRYIEYI